VLNERIEFAIEGFRRSGITLTRRDALEMFKGYAPETSSELMPLIEKELAQTGLNSQMVRTTKGKRCRYARRPSSRRTSFRPKGTARLPCARLATKPRTQTSMRRICGEAAGKSQYPRSNRT